MIHAIHFFVLLLIPHFYFCFRFLSIDAAGSGTGFSVYLLVSNTESCDEDDGEQGEGVVEEELADKQEPQMVHSSLFCNNSLAISDERWFLTAGPV